MREFKNYQETIAQKWRISEQEIKQKKFFLKKSSKYLRIQKKVRNFALAIKKQEFLCIYWDMV